jgi:hypothetical protein
MRSQGDCEGILHNIGLLFKRSFASVQELNRRRKGVNARLALAAAMMNAISDQ